MSERSKAFVKGGCGCLLIFGAVALLAVVTGGSAYLDLGGGVCLFVVGGLVGLVVLAIYNKGKRDAGSPVRDIDDSPNT
jgi:hypothetical protein